MKLVLPNATVKIKLLTHLSIEEQQSTSTMYHVLCPRRKVDRMFGGTQSRTFGKALLVLLLLSCVV